jgi:hypothetical protein
MRFVITGEWSKNRLLQTIIVLFVVYVGVLWISNALLYFHKMNLTYASVVEYYLGSEEKFLQPRSYQGMLEILHFHFFAMGMLLLTLTHLMLFVPLPSAYKPFLIVWPFVSALLNEGSNWLVRFVHPLFAYLKIVSFLSLEVSLAVLMILSLWAVFRGNHDAYSNTATQAQSRQRPGENLEPVS